MKSRSLILLVISGCFGIVAAVGMSSVMGKGGASGPEIKMGPVLVSAEAFEHSTFLSEENVRLENWPVDIIPENAVTSFEQIENMAVNNRLSQGLPILLLDLIKQTDVNSLSIPEGYKVVGIKAAADDTMSGLLRPGDKVDVIGIFKVRKKDQLVTRSKTFLKRMTVFSVGGELRRGTERTGGAGSVVVSVLMNEAQAEQYIYVEKEAELRLVMCGPEEGDQPAFTALVDLSDLLGDDSETAPEEGGFVNASGQNEEFFNQRVYEAGSFTDYKFGSDDRLKTSPAAVSTSANRNTGSQGNSGDFAGEDDDLGSLEQDQYPGE